MSVNVPCKARLKAPVPRSHKSMMLRRRQVWNKISLLLNYMSEKCHFSVRMFRRCVLWKMGEAAFLFLFVLAQQLLNGTWYHCVLCQRMIAHKHHEVIITGFPVSTELDVYHMGAEQCESKHSETRRKTERWFIVSEKRHSTLPEAFTLRLISSTFFRVLNSATRGQCCNI